MSKHRVVAKAQKKGRRNKIKAWKNTFEAKAVKVDIEGYSVDELKELAYQRAKEARDDNRSS